MRLEGELRPGEASCRRDVERRQEEFGQGEKSSQVEVLAPSDMLIQGEGGVGCKSMQSIVRSDVPGWRCCKWHATAKSADERGVESKLHVSLGDVSGKGEVLYQCSVVIAHVLIVMRREV